MKLADIPDQIVDSCRERGHSDDTISKMSARELFNEHCMWEGIINYGYGLYDLAVKLDTEEKLCSRTKNS